MALSCPRVFSSASSRNCGNKKDFVHFGVTGRTERRTGPRSFAKVLSEDKRGTAGFGSSCNDNNRDFREMCFREQKAGRRCFRLMQELEVGFQWLTGATKSAGTTILSSQQKGEQCI
ncbi:hypothetical protein SUGI_0927180 [Cryptomeria japonica]|nr:hypothetical protein SUGI_0927180 [Cryptomeria japonica]